MDGPGEKIFKATRDSKTVKWSTGKHIYRVTVMVAGVDRNSHIDVNAER